MSSLAQLLENINPYMYWYNYYIMTAISKAISDISESGRPMTLQHMNILHGTDYEKTYTGRQLDKSKSFKSIIPENVYFQRILVGAAHIIHSVSF